MVYDPIVFEKTLGLWCPEKEHEIAVGVPGRKCTRNESIDENVSRWGVLRNRKSANRKNDDLLNGTHLLLRREVVGSTILGHLVLRHEEVGEYNYRTDWGG
jgi:hypothetical protein